MTISAKELKKNMFGDFIAYLEKIGVGDPFSMDVWMDKAWNRLYTQFEKESDRAMFLHHLPLEAVESIVADKKKAQAERQAKGNGKTIQVPGLVSPEGQPLKK